MSDITERLRDTSHSFTAANGRLEAADTIDAERALADDANTLLDRLWNQMPDPFPDQEQWGQDIEAWQARYRKARQ